MDRHVSSCLSSSVVSVGFEEMQYEGTEGDDVTVRVVMSDVAERDVAVGVSALEDTATGEFGCGERKGSVWRERKSEKKRERERKCGRMERGEMESF